MSWKLLDDRKKILGIFDRLVSEKKELKIRVKGEQKFFSTKFIKINRSDISSGIGKSPELVIEKLIPENGNSIIQSSPEIACEFSIGNDFYRCDVKYLGISTTHPYFGFIITLPGSIEIKGSRKENRFTYENPDLIIVEFCLQKGPQPDKVYTLNVIDCSRYGLGTLVTQKDFELLKILREGDVINSMKFFSASAMIKVDGTVRHTTKIAKGKYQGNFILGIHSEDIIETCNSSGR